MPDQEDNKQVEDRQHDQPERMGVGKPVDLIGDEHAKDDERGWVRPQLVPQQACNDEQLHDAVAQQVECVEVPAADREVLCHAQQLCRHEIVRVLDKLVLRQPGNQADDGFGTDQGEGDPGGTVEQRESALEQQAPREDLVDAALGRRSHCYGSPRSRRSNLGSPGHASNSTARGTRLAAKRTASATTTMSSRGPMTGRNSGMRSMGERTQSAATARAIFAESGTRGSVERRRSNVTQAGRKPARSLSSPGGRRAARTTRSAHEETKTAPPINNPRSIERMIEEDRYCVDGESGAARAGSRSRVWHDGVCGEPTSASSRRRDVPLLRSGLSREGSRQP